MLPLVAPTNAAISLQLNLAISYVPRVGGFYAAFDWVPGNEHDLTALPDTAVTDCRVEALALG